MLFFFLVPLSPTVYADEFGAIGSELLFILFSFSGGGEVFLELLVLATV